MCRTRQYRVRIINREKNITFTMKEQIKIEIQPWAKYITKGQVKTSKDTQMKYVFTACLFPLFETIDIYKDILFNVLTTAATNNKNEVGSLVGYIKSRLIG